MTDPSAVTRWLTDDEQRAWRAYLAASGRLQQTLDADLQRDAGMPHAYYMILAMLSETPSRGARMTELAESLMISASRLSHAVKRLEALGWIRKDADPGDGRVTYACLTDAGLRALVDAAPGHVATVASHVFDTLTAEQVGQLYEISAAILGALAPGQSADEVLRLGRTAQAEQPDQV
ncbi:MAG TPA: MarR family transcriptional regulator [Terrimesophilobacter sp.]|nr:MarR family transcriptional regulator [Terrimesophilobacter sp.]